MAKLHMTSEAMVAVSARWIDPARDRHALESVAVTRALLTSLDEVHRALHQQVAQSVRRAQRVRAAAERQRELLCERRRTLALRSAELRGEVLTRLAVLAARTERAGDAAEAAGYRRLAGQLVLCCGQRQGAAPEPMTEQLALVQVRDEVLGELIDQWIAAAGERAELDVRRSRLGNSSPVSVKSSPVSGEMARREWLRMAETLEAVLEQQPAADAGDGDERARLRELILGPLRRAEALADRRAASCDRVSAPAVRSASVPAVVIAAGFGRAVGGQRARRVSVGARTWPV